VESGYETIREVSGDFQVDLQDKACCRWLDRVYKAIFVARGFSQKEGEDYDETLAPIATRHMRSLMSTD
jgi:hypothetical protein